MEHIFYLRETKTDTMLNLFKRKNSNIQQEWQTKGAEYASAVNEMVRFAEEHGWDNWKGEDPSDKRG
ncbi:hypothetical protein SAMN04487898_10113 [Pedobacter sp. ok626]|uniref:hypothetical protein n=1 Tax=Pedobacter sp. ok626 TaxID=1761882 RepID=UPI000886BC00|nr:hypothetical protein [Pedobacter sp. ok626]SDI98884.1 hypothetical protein SAMN04487898_10113 [Pedobacter sp. ok626]